MAKKAESSVLKTLLNYKKYEKNRHIPWGHGWVLRDEFVSAWLIGRRDQSRLEREWDARGYLRLKNPIFEVKSKKSESLPVLINGVEWKKSGYRVKRDYTTFKKVLVQLWDEKEWFFTTDYFQDLKKHYEQDVMEFEKVFGNGSAKLMSELFISFLIDYEVLEKGRQMLEFVKESVRDEYKEEYARLVELSKRALKLAKKKEE